jgi:hypothetical protein
MQQHYLTIDNLTSANLAYKQTGNSLLLLHYFCESRSSREEDQGERMSKSDDIEHFVRMIKAHAESLYGVLTHNTMGYLSRLEKIANSGGFVTEKTEEAIGLKNTEENLRGLADRIALVRESLILNERRSHVGTRRNMERAAR